MCMRGLIWVFIVSQYKLDWTFIRVLRPIISNAEKGNNIAFCIYPTFVFLGLALIVFTQRIRKKQYTFQVVCNVIRTVTWITRLYLPCYLRPYQYCSDYVRGLRSLTALYLPEHSLIANMGRCVRFRYRIGEQRRLRQVRAYAQICLSIRCSYTVKPVSSGHSKIDKTKVLKTNDQ